MLTRLIYASDCAEDLSPAGVEALLLQARRDNQARGITGIMLFNSQRFLQAIEGDREAINLLYGVLARDRRHRHLVLLAYGPAPKRLFARWSMGFASARNADADLYLQHGPSARFDPHALTGPGALALLLQFAAAAKTPALDS